MILLSFAGSIAENKQDSGQQKGRHDNQGTFVRRKGMEPDHQCQRCNNDK